jgi:hypothetical protein
MAHMRDEQYCAKRVYTSIYSLFSVWIPSQNTSGFLPSWFFASVAASAHRTSDTVLHKHLVTEGITMPSAEWTACLWTLHRKLATVVVRHLCILDLFACDLYLFDMVALKIVFRVKPKQDISQSVTWRIMLQDWSNGWGYVLVHF